MTIDDPITRRGVMAGAAATAVLAATRAHGATRPQRRPHAALDRRSEPPHRGAATCRPSSSRARISNASSASTAGERLYHGDLPSKRSRRRARSKPSSRAASAAGRCTAFRSALKDNIDTAGHSDDGRERRVRGPRADRGRRVRAQAARRGRGVPRQAQHARVRLRRHVGRHALRARAQSVGSRLQPRRLVGRLGAPRSRRACAPPRSARTPPRPCAFRPRAAASRGSRRRMVSRAFAASCRCRSSTITSGRSRAASRTARS